MHHLGDEHRRTGAKAAIALCLLVFFIVAVEVMALRQNAFCNYVIQLALFRISNVKFASQQNYFYFINHSNFDFSLFLCQFYLKTKNLQHLYILVSIQSQTLKGFFPLSDASQYKHHSIFLGIQ